MVYMHLMSSREVRELVFAMVILVYISPLQIKGQHEQVDAMEWGHWEWEWIGR